VFSTALTFNPIFAAVVYGGDAEMTEVIKPSIGTLIVRHLSDP
jgi:hypothetical protein